jgi:iron(III) transport system substrate-binding protein
LRQRSLPLGLVLAGLVVVGCSGAAGPNESADASPQASADAGLGSGDLTVYSGRSENLVGPIVEQFEAATGIDVDVRYAGTSELAVTILEEGDASPADVFFAQDGGALGAVADEGRLTALPAEILDRVPPEFRSPDDEWVGISGRARVLAYDSGALDPADLPASVHDLTDPVWAGRVGWAPTNASNQSFVTALRVLEGEDAAREWLEGMLANEPRTYDGNDAILAAIAAGEIEVGLVNHYYALRQQDEQGAAYPVVNHFFAGGDPGALINVAGAGVLTTAPNPAAAEAFIAYLLSEDGQAYFAGETFEYPLVEGVDSDAAVVPLADIEAPDVDLSDLASLEETLTLLQETGVL